MGVIEQTLLFHLWLKKDKYLKSDFEVNTGEIDSRAMNKVKHYLEMFKDKIIRTGNNLKTPKFHQMLHIVDYIKRHGCPMNYDGSRGENFGKLKIKDNAQLTNKQKETLNFDISRRISEEDIVDEICTVYYQNMGCWPSSFCNETDLMKNANRIQGNVRAVSHSGFSIKHATHPRFKLKVTIEPSDNDDVTEVVSVHVDWGTKSKTPILNFPREVLKKIAHRLYIGSPHIGGKIAPHSIVHGYTEVVINGNTFRAHPCYSKKGCWYDWAYFKWHGFDVSIPARIIMIIDLSNCDITYEMDQDPDTIPDDANERVIAHLTNEKWAIVLAAESPAAGAHHLTDYHFDSCITTRVRLHSDNDIWMVPLTALVGPCFVVYNKNYCVSQDNDVIVDDRTAYVVEPMRKWGDLFLS